MAEAPQRTASTEDGELVRRAQGNDLEAFEALVRRHEQRVYAIARRVTANDSDAEDVTQQTFLSALDGLSAFRAESSFATWINRIATHAALKILRKRAGLPTIPLEESPALDGTEETIRDTPHPKYIADWKSSPSVLVAQHETRALLESALNKLDTRHRLVFVLRDMEGLSVRETADSLGISEANVKVRLLRARLQLREELTHAFGDPATRVAPPEHAH